MNRRGLQAKQNETTPGVWEAVQPGKPIFFLRLCDIFADVRHAEFNAETFNRSII